VCRGDVALVEVDDDRRERLPTQHARRGFSKHVGLLGHDLDAALCHSPVAVGAAAAVGVAALRVLVVLGADTPADPGGLVLGRCSENLGGEAAARRVQVDVPGIEPTVRRGQSRPNS
jgi:hypothetical protein